jgi:hypothetical protein
MNHDAIAVAERRVVEAEGIRARRAAVLEAQRSEGVDTEFAERALGLAERALELTQARLDALRSVANDA